MTIFTGKLKRFNGTDYDIAHPETTWEQVYKGSGNSKIPTAYLPALAISSTYTVANEAAQLALTVQEGDVAVRTDLNKSFIALNDDNANMADWQELLTPTDSVLTVDGRTGVVTLTDKYAAINHNHSGIYSAVGHGHIIADVSGLQNALDAIEADVNRVEKVAFFNIGTVTPTDPEVGTLWLDTN